MDTESSKIAELLRDALKPRPFATPASAAAPAVRVNAPLWMWAPKAGCCGMPPPVPESYEDIPDAPKPFRLGDSAQDPFALCDADGEACEADHNFSWNEFTPRDGQTAQMLEKAANMAAVARAMAVIAKIEKAAAKAAAAAAATKA